VVGAGVGGARVCTTLRELGFEGQITLVGAEPTLPYSRPPLSKSFQTAANDDVDSLLVHSAASLSEAGISLELSTSAVGFDLARRALNLSDGRMLGYDSLIIATGVTPRRAPGSDRFENVHVLRTLADATRLKHGLSCAGHVSVVGCGFVGAEIAATARSLGVQVTIIEAAAEPFSRVVGPEVGNTLRRLHLDHGVDLRCGVNVCEFVGHDRVDRLKLSDGTTVETDLVVIAIGVAPATQWLAGSGLDISNGVLCDEYCSAAPGVFAVGDVARWYNRRFDRIMRVEHWSNAGDQGAAVAHNIVAATPEPYAPLPYFWSDQYDAKIQFLGVPAPDGPIRYVVGGPGSERFVVLYGSADKSRVLGILGFRSARALMRLRPLFDRPASWDEVGTIARELVG
jgi:NADPH-dependent 2,4-dienoyl-CoA reductase/sulfur reductase-like enzyme